MRDYILLYVNGERLKISGDAVFSTLADFLREVRGLTGTKVACGEGACGSCTILLGAAITGRTDIRYQSANACLLRVYQADCRHVVTIEGLGATDGGLSPVQRALAENGGAQCGFCTPGVVVSLSLMTTGCSTGCPKRTEPPSDAAVRDALSGNLCRCTGYLPILQSAAKIDIPSLETASWANFGDAAEKIAADLTDAALETASVMSGDRLLLRPVNLMEAMAMAVAHPGSVVVSGGTAMPEVPGSSRTILSLTGVAELGRITREANTVVIGATATWTDLAAFCEDVFPELSRFLSRFGSPQIRTMGTVGGEVAAAEYNGDILPLLLVQGAMLLLSHTSDGARRSVSFADFIAGDRFRPGELLTEIRLPLPAPGEHLRLYKVARRRAFDRSVFCAAVSVRLSDDGRTITKARVAAGGVGPAPLRLPQCEATLSGAPFTEATMRAAGNAAVAEIGPVDDAYAGADHRRQLVKNLPLRFYHDIIETLASEATE